jgi:hypothetical protein
MPKKYIVRLTDEERDMLNQIVKKRGVAAQRVRRAVMLLKAEVDGPSWAEAKSAEACGCRTRTVENLRERLVTEGVETTLQGKPKSRVRSQVLDGEQEAKIIALRVGHPPQGGAKGTLRLWAEQAMTLAITEAVSSETLQRTLKKTSSRSERLRLG